MEGNPVAKIALQAASYAIDKPYDYQVPPELLDTLHRAGYAAYVVGGCVRDSLLGLTPHDWDLCLSLIHISEPTRP